MKKVQGGQVDRQQGRRVFKTLPVCCPVTLKVDMRQKSRNDSRWPCPRRLTEHPSLLSIVTSHKYEMGWKSEKSTVCWLQFLQWMHSNEQQPLGVVAWIPSDPNTSPRDLWSPNYSPSLLLTSAWTLVCRTADVPVWQANDSKFHSESCVLSHFIFNSYCIENWARFSHKKKNVSRTWPLVCSRFYPHLKLEMIV